jgi:PhnB protein
MMTTRDEQPNAKDIPSDQKDAILYARMSIGGTDSMGSDVSSDRFQPTRRVYLPLSVDSTGEAERVFALLSDRGEIFMPMEETFFAHRFAVLRDKFGTSWMIINERIPQQG